MCRTTIKSLPTLLVLLVVISAMSPMRSCLLRIMDRVGSITNREKSNSHTHSAYVAHSFSAQRKIDDNTRHIRACIITDPVIIGNLYYYTTSTVPSSVSDPGSGNTLLYGFVKVRDPYALVETDVYKDVQDLLVEAWDQDSGEPYSDDYSPSGAYIDSTRTDLQSAFYIIYDTDGFGDTWPYQNADPFVQFYADILGVVAIYDGSNRIYVYRMYNDYSDLSSGAYSLWIQGSSWYDPVSGDQLYKNDAMTVNAETTTSGSAVYVLGGPVGELIVFAMLANDFATNELGEYGLPRLNVTYPASTSVYFYNTTDSRLWAAPDTNYTEFFMAYAQFLLAQYSALPSFERNYNFSVHTDQTTAWVVGWSIFLSEVIKNYYSNSENFELRDLESLYDTDHSRNDEDVASSVAGVLWDLYDANNDDQDGDGIGDTLSVNLSDIWYVVRNYKPTTIFDFINGLLSYRNDLNKTKVWELCWEHGINIDSEPPTQPDILNINPPPSMTDWYNTSEICISWSQSTDSFSGMKGYIIRVYHYDNGSLFNWYDVPSGQISTTIGVPSGVWSICVVAIDRAGNEKESLRKGPIKIDIITPKITSHSPQDGIDFIDNESGDIILGITCEDKISGIDKVYIRYKYGNNGDWSPWILASNVDGEYRIVISAGEWKPHVGVRLHWEAKCVDMAGNIVLGGQFYVDLIDDDSEPPSIDFPNETITIYDSNTADLTIWVNISDQKSGVKNVTFIIYFGDASIIYDNSSIMWSGQKAYVIIPRDVWLKYVGSVISLEVLAYDGDNDWPGDSALASSEPNEYGVILDDDLDPPIIHGVKISEYIGDGVSGDGVIEADESLRIEINVSDVSGVNTTVIVMLNGKIFVGEAQISYTNGTFYTLILINVSPLWAGDIEVAIKIYDLDNDGWKGDSAYSASKQQIHVSAEEATFLFGDTEIDALANETVEINFTIGRNDGGIMPLEGQEVYVEIYNSSGLISTMTVIYGGEGTVATIDLASLHTVGDYITLEFYLNDSIFVSKSNDVWIHVWSTTTIKIHLNTTLVYSQTVTINVTLVDMFGNPVPNAYVYISLLSAENKTVLLAGDYTDNRGMALIQWQVDIPEGNHTLIARFDEDSIRGYHWSEALTRIYVRRANLVIRPSNATFIFSDGGIIYANILTELDVPVDGAYAEIYVLINDTKYLLGYNTTDNGYLEISVDQNSYPEWLGLGNYTYILNVSSSDKYYGASAEAMLVVEKDVLESVEIITNASTIDWGDYLLIRVFVMDDDKYPIVHGKVNISIDVAGEIVLSTVLEVENGMAEWLIDTQIFSPYQQIAIDAYVWSSLYQGEVSDKYYVSIYKEKVYAYALTIVNYTWSVIYQNVSNLTLVFKDNDGKPVLEDMGQVVIVVDGTYMIYNGTLKSEIQISYPFSTADLLPGTYHIEIELVSGVYEYVNESRIILNIEKIPTFLIVNISSNKTEYGDPIEINITLIDWENKALAGVPITVYLISSNGTRYLVGASTTDENGSTRILADMNFLPDQYMLSIQSAATSIHASSFYECGFVIVKEHVSIEAKLPDDLEAGSEVNIRVRLQDNDGEVVKGVIIEISIDNEPLVRTICNGSLSIIWIPDSGGSHVVKIGVFENAYYVGAMREISVKVKSLPVASGTTYGLILVGVFGGIGTIFVVSRRIRFRSRPRTPEQEVLEEESVEEEFLEVFESEELEL